jgi:hypothetical protein
MKLWEQYFGKKTGNEPYKNQKEFRRFVPLKLW